jgi:hypothetical protein
MYTLKSKHSSYQLVSLAYDEVILETECLETANQFLFAKEIIELLAPELESNLFLDQEFNCSCDEYGDIWVNPNFILQLQELTGMSLELLLVIIIAHELGHALLLEADADSYNEVAAWLIGERLFLRLYGEEDLNSFIGIKDALLPTYEQDEKYLSWFEEAQEESSKGLNLLETL